MSLPIVSGVNPLAVNVIPAPTEIGPSIAKASAVHCQRVNRPGDTIHFYDSVWINLQFTNILDALNNVIGTTVTKRQCSECKRIFQWDSTIMAWVEVAA